jgi:hypothetical protein
VEEIEDGVAHVVLEREDGRQAWATCSAKDLESYGIGPGGDFTCTFFRRGNESGVRFEAIAPRKRTPEEAREARRAAEEALGNYDPATDR